MCRLNPMVYVVHFDLYHRYHLYQRQGAPCWSLTEDKYRLEIVAQKLTHYDSAECMIADRFQDFTLANLIENNLPLATIDYWMRLRRKQGLNLIG